MKTRSASVKVCATALMLSLSTVLLTLIPVSPAGAFSRSASASYQTEWWNGRNPVFYDESPTDCANYVSQTLFAGGEARTSDWYNIWGRGVSADWDNSQDLFNFLYLETLWAQYEINWAYWLQGAAPPTNGTGNGDPYFYNWNALTNGEGYSGIDHATVQHSIGTDGNGKYGDLVSSHDTDRQNLFWSEQDATNPSNPYYHTEEVFADDITS
jgi:hypothetical protein